MKSVELKQSVSFQIKVQFGVPLVVFFAALSFINLWFLSFLCLSLVLFFCGYTYIFNDTFKHEIVFTCVGIKLFSFKKNFIKPDYISLFHQSYKQTNVFGYMEVGKSKWKIYTIKLFKSNVHETVFKSYDKDEVVLLGLKLSNVLDVELYNNLK